MTKNVGTAAQIFAKLSELIGNSRIKTEGGGVMLIVSITMNPKIREDLNHLSKIFFEGIWTECKFDNIKYNETKANYKF